MALLARAWVSERGSFLVRCGAGPEHQPAVGCSGASARWRHGLLARDQEDYQPARALHQQSLALYQELGDQHGIAEALDNLGHVASAQGNYDRAIGFFEQSLVFYSIVGNKQQMASAVIGMANIAWSQQDRRWAKALFQQSLALSRDSSSRKYGLVAGWLGDDSASRRRS